VHVVATNPFDIPASYTDANGSGTWQGHGIRNPFTYAAGSDPVVTENNGMENVAVYGLNGELDFFWQNGSGHFVKETVAAVGVN